LNARELKETPVIVTRNPRDFPDAVLGRYRPRAIHPDLFLRRPIDQAPDKFVDVVREQQASLIKPPIPMSDFPSHFERLDLIETVAELRRSMD